MRVSPTPLMSEDGAALEASPTAASPSRARLKLANAREKIKLLRGSRSGAPSLGLDMGDVIEEAQLNKSAVLNTLGAAAELIQNLSVPLASRRAVHLREIAELGRHIKLPDAWFRSEHKKILTWYHVVQNLKLVEFEEGDVVFLEGQPAECAYWFLGDKTENSKLMKKMEAPNMDPVVMRDISQAKSLGMAASSIVKGPMRDEITSIPIWQGVGLEALRPGEAHYPSTVVAAVKGAAAVITKQDYAAILAMLQHVSSDSMKVVSLLLRAKPERGPQDNKDIAGILSVFDMFNTMDDEFRQEAAALVEYMYCPEGFVLFEEGDRADFNYIVLQGNVRMIKHHQEMETKTTGQQFGSAVNIVNGKKKRPCTAICTSPCEMAIMSRISYNRIVKKQLQDVMHARSELLKSLANVDTDAASLQRIASFCVDEAYSAGSTIVSPQKFPFKVLIIMEGEAKEVWDPDDVHDIPPAIDSIEDAKPLRIYQPMRKSHARARERRKKQKDLMKDATASADALTPTMPGHCFPTGPRKHAVELAKLGKGDIVNGLTLLGRPPQFNVIAHTKVKVLSFDSETSETAFGPQLFLRICKLVQAKHNWCRERLLHNLAVRESVGASNLLKKQAVDPNLKSSAMAHFLDHYVPEDPDADNPETHKSRPQEATQSLNHDEPNSKHASPRASEDTPNTHHFTPDELSAIRSTVVKGKDPPPPRSVMPWHSASCPPHLANFREAITNAAAEAANVTSLVMRSSAATAGGVPPSFVQELMAHKEAQPEEAYAPASHFPPGWGPPQPVFAGQVCTTFLDMDLSHAMQGMHARRSPDRDAFRRQPSQGAGRAPSQTASRAWTSGPPTTHLPPSPGMPPLKPSSTPSSPLPPPPITLSTTPRAATILAAASLLNTQHQGEGNSTSTRTNTHTAHPQRGNGSSRSSNRSTHAPHSLAHTAPPTLHSLPPHSYAPTPSYQPELSPALSLPSAPSPPPKAPVFHTHKGPSTLPPPRAGLSNSWTAEGGGGPDSRGEHPQMTTAATLSPRNSAADDVPSWLNKDNLPHLPNSPHPLLVSDTLRQRMLQQPCSSPATARYTRQRTSTLVSNSTDLPQHPRPSISSIPNPWLPTNPATTTTNASSSNPWLGNAAPQDGTTLSSKPSAAHPHHSTGAHHEALTHTQHESTLPPATAPQRHRASHHNHHHHHQHGHFSPPSAPTQTPPLVPPLHADCGPPSSAASAASGATRRSQAALGASVFKPPGSAGAQGVTWEGCEDTGVVILPHMMSVYHGVLENDRGFYSKDSQGQTWPRTQQKQRDRLSVSLRSMASQQSRGSEREPMDAGEGLEQGPGSSRLQSPSSPPSWRKRPSRNNMTVWGSPRPSLGLSLPARLQKQAQQSAKSREPTSPRADEPHLPLDRDEGAPALQDHTLSDPTLDDISYILHRWGARWQEERAAAIYRRKQREAQMQGVPAPAITPMDARSSTETERLQAFGVPCAAPQPFAPPQYQASSVGSFHGLGHGSSSNGSSRPTSRARNEVGPAL